VSAFEAAEEIAKELREYQRGSPGESAAVLLAKGRHLEAAIEV